MIDWLKLNGLIPMSGGTRIRATISDAAEQEQSNPICVASFAHTNCMELKVVSECQLGGYRVEIGRERGECCKSTFGVAGLW